MARPRFALVFCVAAGCTFDASVPGSADATAGFDAGPTLTPIALYEFDEGSGPNIRDTSGIDPPVDLFISNEGAIQWLPGTLEIQQQALIETPGPATKISNACIATGQCSIEVWVTPANDTQGGTARIVSLGSSISSHNFLIGADGTQYHARYRTTDTDGDGRPAVLGASGTVTVALTHVVLTVSGALRRRLYVNAVLVAEDAALGGNTSTWDNSFVMGFGDEVDDQANRFWLGQLHRIAIFTGTLTGQQVFDRYMAGHE